MNNQHLIIEPILPLSTLQGAAPKEEWQQAQEFTSLRRQREWLSWRVHLRAYLGEDIRVAYTEQGAPYIIGNKLYISVSHTQTHVAILLSSTPCAVDMELLSRNFDRVSSRYISDEESQIITTTELKAIAWCAKEAAYKFTPEGCDFLRDVTILKVENSEVAMRIRERIVAAQYVVNEEFAVVWIDGLD